MQDSPQVSRKKSTDLSQKLKLKGIELLYDAVQLEIDTQKAIKASKRERRFKHQSGGSSEGAEVLDETKDKSEAQDDLKDWGSTNDETFLFDDKEKNPKDILWVSTGEDEDDDDDDDEDDEDDERIDIETTDDEKTDTYVEDQVKGVAEMNIDEEAEEEKAKKVEEQKADEELKAVEEQQGDD
ncbi:hypothetical protein Tco_0777366 [Tanacetum coccineum]